MLINKKLVIAVTAALALGVTSCRKFLDVNTNPNISQTATVETLLPAAQLYVGSAVGVDLQINGSIWAQYWTQTPVASQYIALEQYSPGQDVFSTPWKNLYAAAENFYQLYKLADSQKKKPYKAIALLMQAYTFQMLSDGWGDVPMKYALQGQYLDGHIVNPKYDSQRVVYSQILGYIDSANKLIAEGSKLSVAGDLIYNGSMTRWTKFSNTLRMKVLLRMAYVDPTGAKARMDSLYAKSPTFIGNGDDAVLNVYGGNSNTKSPLYAEISSSVMVGVQNLAGSSTAVDSLNNNNDPRAYLFYSVNSAGGISGITQGSYNVSVPGGSYSTPSGYVGGDLNDATNSAKAPVNLITASESYFLQAEVVARGWQGMSSSLADDSLFYYGIKANFSYYGSALAAAWGTDTAYKDYMNGGGYWTMYPIGGTTEDRLRFIITQKWFAMDGNQAFEAWTEWRRTGYPDFLIHPKNSLIGTDRPARFLYPTSESTTNTNFPGVVGLTTKMWWDKN
jgi:hypothetical protein